MPEHRELAMKRRNCLFFLICSGVGTAQAGELVQNFVNPSFGGNPLNGSHLLSVANAINDYKAPATPATPKASAAELFSQQVDRLIMSALANRLVNKAFGTDTSTLPDTTTLDTGVNTISVVSKDGGTEVTVVDNATGAQSVIFIPDYSAPPG